ncbi:pyrroloquinoline quinone precursor peptide PqqA [Actinomadura barringtoniae]|uniref:Coenzyme PQQ synthesis protein A n=1 Tax=Actinomadura barringtoniae TaxID=1427535 RepID=A0A939PLX3_9ACTN|nr:pyrroloquinoline quinone precursor peptide PqqA [Actinomadura barringtoniae]MBO2455367.1 pyrroloquinoline quinone precursor peptide PqqA [Actinomadura barringtoniae]
MTKGCPEALTGEDIRDPKGGHMAWTTPDFEIIETSMELTAYYFTAR